MADQDGDDWFDKDIEDFVVHKKVEAKTSSENANFSYQKIAFYEREHEGNYFDPTDVKFSNHQKNKQATPSDADQFIQKIPYKKLLWISELEELDIFAEIVHLKYEFVETMRSESLGDDLMLVIMKVLNRICTLPFFEIRIMFLDIVKNEPSFWDQILKFFKKNMNQEDDKKKKKVKVKLGISLEDFYKNLVDLLKNIQMTVELNNELKVFLDHLVPVIKDTPLHPNDKLQEMKNYESDKKPDRKLIYPTIEDFQVTPEVELQKNVTKGKYPSVDYYVDVHMNLLREDFMSSLREGIIEFKEFCKLEHKHHSFWNDSIRLHNPVKIMVKNHLSAKTQKEHFVLVDLDPQGRINGKSLKYQRISWNQSKRFMYGALLCFSSTVEMDDLIVAVVCGREIELLSNGYIFVEIMQITNCKKIFDQEFVMIESEIFFEPYHQVFNVFRTLNDSNFPLKSYIVDMESHHRFPDYVAREKNSLYKYKNHMFDVKKMGEWTPSVSSLGLNESQYEAFKLALTNKFALIQGPPGSGKTYMGLEIVSTLLQNTDNQILVICLTNHALDKFLFGITEFTDSIVRMGSQSKHEKLDEYNVKQLTEDVIIDKRVRAAYFNTKKEYIKLIEEFEALDDYVKILEVQNKLRCLSKRINELNQLSTYETIRNKRIIGMTTTFAARNHTLLQLMKTPIVIIEEAAEVLESHIVAALTSSTQHLILIGDHLQLRPTVTEYKMSVQYKMDISLFERMYINNLNCVLLTVQHRMRPELADLIRPTIYSKLLDGDNVINYPNIKGIAKNLFFLNHSNPESEKKDDEKSKKNVFEAQFMAALCNYLIRQGYNAEDIVILTMYNGQMFQLFQEKKNYPDIANVRITVVDNYQGEEAKIILLSLVRSNEKNSIGFLGFSNRICVALSRAMEGLYVVGNMDLLAKCSKIWFEIKMKLEKHGAIGTEIDLACVQHGNLTTVKSVGDFEKIQFGGCQDMCRLKLKCGTHQCEKPCHSEYYPHYQCHCHH